GRAGGAAAVPASLERHRPAPAARAGRIRLRARLRHRLDHAHHGRSGALPGAAAALPAGGRPARLRPSPRAGPLAAAQTPALRMTPARLFAPLLAAFLATACAHKDREADLVVHNAVIHALD